MARTYGCLLLALGACFALLPGCGEGSQAELAVGAKVRDCDVTFIGPGPADWRKRSLWTGPFGLAGPRDGPTSTKPRTRTAC
jgi:hypothetical protein